MKLLPYNMYKEKKLSLTLWNHPWEEAKRINKIDHELVNTYDELGNTPVMHAVGWSEPEERIIAMLNEATTQCIEHKNKCGESIVHWLSHAGYASALRHALKKTTTFINSKDGFGWTPMHWCLNADHLTFEQHKAIALTLMMYGRSIRERDDDGQTPLDLYDINRCKNYEESTKPGDKKELLKLLGDLSIPTEIFFVEWMKMFGLFFEKTQSNDDHRVFVVPSRMKIASTSLSIKEDEKGTVSIYVTLKEFLPDAVYDSLVVNLSQDNDCRDEPVLFQNQAKIGIDGKHYVKLGRITINNRQALKLEISQWKVVAKDGSRTVSQPQPLVCRKILENLKLHLGEVYSKTYDLQVLCPLCASNPPHFQELEYCMNNDFTCDKSAENLKMSADNLRKSFLHGPAPGKEIHNFNSLQFLILDVGTEGFRKMFMEKSKLRKKSEVGRFLIDSKKQNPVLHDVDFDGQNPFTTDADIDKFDMTTLIKLIRYCFYSDKEESFWENPPEADKSELASVVRMYNYKKNVLDCKYSNRMNDEEFEKQWESVASKLESIGVHREIMNRCRRPLFRQLGELKDSDLEEKVNFSTIHSLVYDAGTQQMRKFFLAEAKLDEKDVGNYLLSKRQEIEKSRNLHDDQRDKMFTQDADINTFDISIMMIIIKNHFGSNFDVPSDFWKDPNKTFLVRLTNLVHIQHYRHTCIAHYSSAKMSNEQFNEDFKKLSEYLLKAGASQEEIDECTKLNQALIGKS